MTRHHDLDHDSVDLELTETEPVDDGGPLDPNVEILGAPEQQLPEPEFVAGASATRHRRRYLPRTLGARLVTGVVTLVVVLVLAIGAATYTALHSFLLNRLDQQVQNAASGNIGKLFGAQAGTSPLGRNPMQVWAVALDSSGAVLAQPVGNYASPTSLSAEDRVSLANRTASTVTSVTTSDGVRLRVVTRRVSVGYDPTTAVPGTAVVGLSTDEVTRTIHRLFLLELAVGGGAVLIALLVSLYGVRFSLRPLHRVTRTAQEVTAELSAQGTGLDRRVPISAAETDTEAGQLADSVNTLLGAVENQFAARVESEERMRQFLADASHELRTPLTSIRGYAELARMRRATSRGDGDDSDTLDRIESEGTRMSRLVEDLLMLARSDRGAAPDYQPVDVAELIDDAVEGSRAAHPERQIDIVVPDGLMVLGDHDQLLRVLRNLVTNAAVHTRPDGPIRVSGVADGADVILRVDDSGPGLPQEEAAHVFERFWRADKARTRARGGTGLGLAIVASIIEAHHGMVRFDSTVETGSTVTVRLPAVLPG